uniref:Transposase, YhgA-like n=1 Tax=Candidatus Kentrum sp. DK TaxID=2126562 RepID=A0A450TIU0_9GAMM|nr:MAG: hypothetical protein BECKDK2373C_GA0170839_11624 [Candidatus Kentron sp. DK]
MADKDIISKENIRHLAVDLAIYLLELPIDPDSLEVLSTEHQRVEDRRADLVVKLRDRAGEAFILRILCKSPDCAHQQGENKRKSGVYTE